MAEAPTPTYQSLYRKWRPQRFAEVVHQEYTVRTLQNAILSKQLAHAYLLAGPRGVGKTSIARILAKAVNCANPQNGEPCNACDHCRKITKGTALDVIEIDGASNRGIDQIRRLREEIAFVPAETHYKVYIIDEVHMLTNEAFNALLKTLEEPPQHVIFVFATTEPHKVPLTIISRCQSFELKLLPPERIEQRLKEICKAEEINASAQVLSTIAHRARGALRDATVMLEQLASYKGSQKIEENDLFEIMGLASHETVQGFLQALLQKESRRALSIIADLAERGKDLELFIDELIEEARAWILTRLDGGELSLPIHADLPKLIELSRELLELKREISRAWEKRVLLEVKALELTQFSRGSAAATALSSTAPIPTEKVNATRTAVSEPAPAIATHDKWTRLLEEVKRDRRSTVHAFLLEGQPVERADLLRIEYDPKNSFHKEGLEKYTKYLEEVVQRVYGAVRVEIAWAENDSSNRESGSSPRRKSKSAELREKIKLIQEHLEGEIVN
ncbi:DNA polymerase III subunit gamma/tau [Candidatus Acetothermia bacterium]|jgi:DNA polymerase-3 subunit gamma/tau|nr:DNA polymerase III subunit gamma/tau [Candidatus Acetothermia bacterium]MCI2432568.1 DNA polymerase III subunit gamma/tau [Candidatus Acetothermia bacterium]MCI2435855.1 DNA polymerase III subunit gamma/tau [Candidatus Acetothermia bacterium]